MRQQRISITSLLIGMAFFTAGCSEKGSPPSSVGGDQPGNTSTTKADIDGTGKTNSDKATANKSQIAFETVGAEAGFNFQRYDDILGQRRILEVNGGGVAVFDFDNDGWLDVFMSNGCRLPRSLSSSETPGKLFRNKRHFQFEGCSENSGLMQLGFGTGCAVADLNEDGFEDLYVATYGENQFWLNNGDGTLEPVSVPADAARQDWSSSVAFADINGDSLNDLFIVNYLVESDEDPTLCPNQFSPGGYEGCPPSIFDGVPDRLLLNDGSGSFIDATDDVGLAELPGKGLGVVICDLGGDTRPEIFVANDGEPNHLFEIAAAKDDTFKLHNVAIAANVALSESGYAQAGMGVAAADFDHSGTIDLFLTHFYADTNTLYLNRSKTGPLSFDDATRISRLGPPSRLSLGFGVAAIDADNDGWQDLFVANGHIDDRTWAQNAQPYRMNPQFFQNESTAQFREISTTAGPFFEKQWLGRGVAEGDLDRDGRVDLTVSLQLDPSKLLRNVTTTNNSGLTLKLIGTHSARTPIGARVTVESAGVTLEQRLSGGGSFQSASVNELHFGISTDDSITTSVTWPSGRTQHLTSLRPGTWFVVEGRAAKQLP